MKYCCSCCLNLGSRIFQASRIMPDSFNFLVDYKNSGTRLDKFLYNKLKTFTRTRIQALILEGNVSINGKIKSKSYEVRENDIIFITIPDAVLLNDTKPENIPLDIIYEDRDLLLVNKAKGMVVHPAAGNWDGTLVNALLFHCKGKLSDINGIIRPGIVHRIDKDTSGILIVAKNNLAHQHLAEQIKNHSFFREYEAIAHGIFSKKSDEINLPIGRDVHNRKRFSVTLKNSKVAITLYRVINTYEKFSHLRLILKTGRTHQIRVHMAHINHFIAGDTLYGSVKNFSKTEKALNGQCLHAKYMGFIHPRSGKFIEFETDLPEYFSNFLNRLKGDSS